MKFAIIILYQKFYVQTLKQFNYFWLQLGKNAGKY